MKVTSVEPITKKKFIPFQVLVTIETAEDFKKLMDAYEEVALNYVTDLLFERIRSIGMSIN